MALTLIEATMLCLAVPACCLVKTVQHVTGTVLSRFSIGLLSHHRWGAQPEARARISEAGPIYQCQRAFTILFHGYDRDGLASSTVHLITVDPSV